MKSKTIMAAISLLLAALISCSQEEKIQFDKTAETAVIEKVLNNVFGWAIDKNFDLFYQSIANDSEFISVTPYNRVKFGFAEVQKDSAFWGSPNFKAISHNISDLKLHFSKHGDVAWFFCRVNDYNTWKDQPANWENVRWTGVLEKRNGQWRVVQQHFSWANEN